jgi:glucose-6-phosphate 1-dehydrogenase
VFRLGNAVFEPIWNRRHIDHVQLTVAESIGVEGRGAFYETAGAFRDVMQNHMFMLLALIAIEPPTSLEGEAVRNEKVKLLKSICRMTPEEALKNTVRGQYGEGVVDGKRVPAYREEPNVDPNSTVETFAATKLMIESGRAILPSLRETDAAPHDKDCRSIQDAALVAVCDERSRSERAKLPDI